MGKIDTSEWKKYRMSDLGFTVCHGSRITKAERVEGDTVFLTAGFENCGVVGTIGNKNIDVWEKPITVDMFGNVFYHDEACAGDDNIYAFLNSELSRTAKLFVASSVASVTQNKYSYQQQFRQGDANKLSVYLPCTPNGDPDWAYMESYMANIETKVAESLTMLQAAKDAEKKKVDTREWGEFRVGELFDAALSKDDIQPKVIVEGNTPLVSSGKENNGIIALIDNKNARLWEANTLTVDMFGKVFYQEQPYYAVSHGRVNILMPRMPMTKHCMQFIGCAIERVTTDKYAFSEMCTGTKLLKDVILLPKDKTGQPDWAYMEEYMREMEERVKVMMGKYEMTVNEAAL